MTTTTPTTETHAADCALEPGEAAADIYTSFLTDVQEGNYPREAKRVLCRWVSTLLVVNTPFPWIDAGDKSLGITKDGFAGPNTTRYLPSKS